MLVEFDFFSLLLSSPCTIYVKYLYNGRPETTAEHNTQVNMSKKTLLTSENANIACEMNYEGQIHIIFGPMFSGKTTELIRRMRRYQIANHECLLIKYAKDVRYDTEGVVTHDKQNLPAQSACKLADLWDTALKADVVGIDEGQFFPDIVSFSEKIAARGKIVIVAALDGTYQMKGFGDILNLVPLSESVVKLGAVCMQCFQNASFTKRTSTETQVEVIGGADKYLAVCRKCFQSPSVKASPRKNHCLKSGDGVQRKLNSSHILNNLTNKFEGL